MSNGTPKSGDWFADALGSCGEVVNLIDVEVNDELMHWHGIPVQVFGRVRIHDGNLRLVEQSIAALGDAKYPGHKPDSMESE